MAPEVAMSKVWIVWKVECWEDYSLISAHRTRDAAIKAALQECWLKPEQISEEEGHSWNAFLGAGDQVMVEALPLQKGV